MTPLLMTLNIFAGLFLIGVVLLQSGKGADMGAAFGGASSTVFGPSGAGNVLTKVTAATAATFMITSLLLAVISSRQESVFDGVSDPTAETAPLGAADPIAPVGTDVEEDTATLKQKLDEATQASAAAVDGLLDSAGKAADAGGVAAGEAADTASKPLSEVAGTDAVPPPSPPGE